MKILKWLSVADRFYKIYLDKQLAPFGVNSSQHMILIKICDSPGILQDSLMDIFYIHPSNIVRTVIALEKQGIEEIRTVCERTESLLLQGIDGTEKELFIDLLMRAGKNITAELHIERKEEDFDD